MCHFLNLDLPRLPIEIPSTSVSLETIGDVNHSFRVQTVDRVIQSPTRVVLGFLLLTVLIFG